MGIYLRLLCWLGKQCHNYSAVFLHGLQCTHNLYVVVIKASCHAQLALDSTPLPDTYNMVHVHNIIVVLLHDMKKSPVS